MKTKIRLHKKIFAIAVIFPIAIAAAISLIDFDAFADTTSSINIPAANVTSVINCTGKYTKDVAVTADASIETPTLVFNMKDKCVFSGKLFVDEGQAAVIVSSEGSSFTGTLANKGKVYIEVQGNGGEFSGQIINGSDAAEGPIGRSGLPADNSSAETVIYGGIFTGSISNELPAASLKIYGGDFSFSPLPSYTVSGSTIIMSNAYAPGRVTNGGNMYIYGGNFSGAMDSVEIGFSSQAHNTIPGISSGATYTYMNPNIYCIPEASGCGWESRTYGSLHIEGGNFNLSNLFIANKNELYINGGSFSADGDAGEILYKYDMVGSGTYTSMREYLTSSRIIIENSNTVTQLASGTFNFGDFASQPIQIPADASATITGGNYICPAGTTLHTGNGSMKVQGGYYSDLCYGEPDAGYETQVISETPYFYRVALASNTGNNTGGDNNNSDNNDNTGGNTGGDSGTTNPGGATNPGTTNPGGAITNPDGSITNPDGSTTYPNGITILPDGTIVYPDGTTTSATGSVTNYDGSITYTDGTIRYANGTVVRADGTTYNSDQLSVPNTGLFTIEDNDSASLSILILATVATMFAILGAHHHQTHKATARSLYRGRVR